MPRGPLVSWEGGVGKKVTAVLYSSGSSDMDKDMIPKFASKDEELDYWRSQALKYKKRWVALKRIMAFVSSREYSVKLTEATF